MSKPVAEMSFVEIFQRREELDGNFRFLKAQIVECLKELNEVREEISRRNYV